MPVYIALLIGAMGIVSSVLFIKAFRAGGGFRKLSLTSVLIFSAVLLPNLTTVVAMFRAERLILTDPFFNRIVEYTGLSLQINQLASPALLAIALIIFVLQLGRNPHINPAAFWFLPLLVIGALAKWNLGGAILDGGHATLVAVVAAAVVLPGGREALRGGALGVGLLLCFSALGALIQPAVAAPPCDSRKCGLLGTFYVGVADNQNTFGMLMAFAIPVLYFGLSRHNLWFAFAATFFAFASGARTAAVAASVTLVAILLVHLGRNNDNGAKLGGTLAILTAAGAGITAMIVPFLKLPPGTFSDRAGLWDLARSMVEESWLIGHGSMYWRSLVDIGLIPLAAGYSTHNQAMETLFVAGALGVAAMLLVLVMTIRRNGGGFAPFAILMLPVAIACITERPWSLGAVDWASWSLLIFLCSQTSALHGADELPISTVDSPERLAPHLRELDGVLKAKALRR